MSPRSVAAKTFRSLRGRNYRLYFGGQIVSLSGTWLQSVALSWLVLRLTGSGVALGFVVAVQFAPMLLAGPWGGLIADRVDKRRMLVITQSSAAALALLLGVLVMTGAIQLWMVFALAFTLGLVNLVDLPTRTSFVMEMVGRDDVANAVSLNSVVMNASRVIGPAAAGILIATVGVGACFVINAASYLAVIAGLLLMRAADLHREAPTPRAKGQLREGFRYAWGTPELRVPLLVMAVVGTLAYNFSIVIPLLAERTFHGGPGAYGALFSVLGLGAVAGGLVVAARGRTSARLQAAAAVAFGTLIGLAALAPSLRWELIALVPVGAASTAFLSTSNSLLQVNAKAAMRGRVMSLFTMLFVGTTPIGGPLVGWVAERFGPRASLGVGGAATLIAGVAATVAMRRMHRVAARRVPRTAPLEDLPAAAVSSARA